MKSSIVFRIIVMLAFCLVGIDYSRAQTLISNEEKGFVIDSLAKIYAENYVFPEVGNDIASLLRKNYERGRYNDELNPIIFAEMVKSDIMTINGDKHVSVVFDPFTIGKYLRSLENDDEEFAFYSDELSRFKNHYFEEVKILDGNIGYVKFSEFSDARGVAETIEAIIMYLKNTDAIIFDIRKNNGGSPLTVQLLVSYFVYPHTKLSTLYSRPDENYKQMWSIPLMNKYTMPDKEVIILTGPGTFSAAEGFTYAMKNLELATIVGQPTGGGAHLTSYFALNENFYAGVPTGRNINAVTNTNWEGKGIEPHISVDVEYALDTARLLLLNILKAKYRVDDFRQEVYDWELERLACLSRPLMLDKKAMKKYSGEFENISVYVSDNVLFFKKADKPANRLIAMGNNKFMFPDLPDYRVEFIMEEGEAIAIQGIYANGRSDWFDRTE
jgi:hypothetical protein